MQADDFDVNELVVSSNGEGLAALNHKTIDAEIGHYERYIANLKAWSDGSPAWERLIATEQRILDALIAERDSAERKRRRLTENDDGSVKRVPTSPEVLEETLAEAPNPVRHGEPGRAA
ncbi:hypothetical protein D3C72_815390 [compost metagenome]